MLNTKQITIYLIFCLSVFLGLFLGENSGGGSLIDHKYTLPAIENFSIDIENGFKIYLSQNLTIIHSPSFYVIAGFFLRITQNILIVKIIYIIISCFIPFIFYLIIKEKYKIKKDYIFYFSLLIFLSPYFRSSAIWLLGDNLSLLFFSLSVLFFVKIDIQKNKLLNYYLCFFFLILCCYIRYYYCVFSIYFLIYFYKNLKLKTFFNILIISFFLSTPAFFYLYLIITKFNFFGTISNFGSLNYYSNTLIILSIILFYFLPFIIKNSYSIFEFYKNKYKRILFVFLLILLIYFLDLIFQVNLIDFSSRGGGVFVKLSNLFGIDTGLFLSAITFISLIVTDYLFKDNRLENYILLIILICCFPFTSIYQKYLDPLFYFIFFGLVNSTHIKNLFLKEKLELTLIYFYFSSFFLFSSIYYYKGA